MQPPPGEPGSGSGNSWRLEHCLSQQIDLCERLEWLADSLPARIDTYAAKILADRLVPTLKSCHQIEETRIFPVLMIMGTPETPILDRLRKEHLEDEDLAAEVRDAVNAIITRKTRTESELVGYMLRCLFVSVQRHMAFERDHMLPLCRRIDTSAT